MVSQETHYNRLRSRMFNLRYCRKHLRRQVTHLAADMRTASPEDRAAAIRDGVVLGVNSISHREIRWRTKQHPELAADLKGALKEIFGSELALRR